MSALIALALAAELGQNAPDDLKPCSSPVIEKQAPKTDPNHAYLKHIRRLKTDCGEVPPLLGVLFPTPDAPLNYTPAPEEETFAAAPDTPTPVEEVLVTDGQEPRGFSEPGAAPFIYLPGPINTVYLPGVIPPAPELETWLLMLAGLGAIAWRRRA